MHELLCCGNICYLHFNKIYKFTENLNITSNLIEKYILSQSKHMFKYSCMCKFQEIKVCFNLIVVHKGSCTICSYVSGKVHAIIIYFNANHFIINERQ